MNIRWFPQSFVQVRTDEHEVCIDPAMMDTVGDILRSFVPVGKGRPLPQGMVPADVILVSHHHNDHLDRNIVRQLTSERTLVLAPEKCMGKIPRGGRAVAAGQSLEHEGIKVEVVHAYNPPGSRSMTFHKKGECVGFVLEVGGRRLYHAGDTGLIDEMKGLGRIDLAFLPIGGKFTMDIAEAVEAVRIISPSMVVPMHMLKADPLVFKETVEREPSAKVSILSPGESIRF